MDDIEEAIDFIDFDQQLSKALYETRQEFYDRMQNEIEYGLISKKITELTKEIKVMEYLGRKNENLVNSLELYKSIRDMLKHMQMSIESILFVDVVGE